jgi:hypothetical protein
MSLANLQYDCEGFARRAQWKIARDPNKETERRGVKAGEYLKAGAYILWGMNYK